MNKQGLIEAVASSAHLNKSRAEGAVDAVLESIRSALKKGSDVRLVGFGTFRVAQRAASAGRNPRTGETIQIAARKVPRFRAGKELREAVG
jgi:DNA-binding protein HU-beta